MTKEEKKQKLLTALEKSFGVVTTACRNSNISRQTFYNYYNEDPEFKKSCDDISEIALDMAESQLHKQILDGNTSATIFYLKTKGKKRGFVERQEFTGADGDRLFEIEIIKRDDKNEDSD